MRQEVWNILPQAPLQGVPRHLLRQMCSEKARTVVPRLRQAPLILTSGNNVTSLIDGRLAGLGSTSGCSPQLRRSMWSALRGCFWTPTLKPHRPLWVGLGLGFQFLTPTIMFFDALDGVQAPPQRDNDLTRWSMFFSVVDSNDEVL